MRRALRLGSTLTAATVLAAGAVAQPQPDAAGATAPAAASDSSVARPASSPGATFEEGVAAYDRGEFERAFALWLPLAEQGRVAAQFNLAALYENGQGVAQSDAQAAHWYLKAAEQGDAEAQFRIGSLFEQGKGVPRDLDKASYWYGKVLAEGRGATRQTVRLARDRLAALSRVDAPGDVFAYPGGRFVIRSAESGDCVVALQGDINRRASAAFEKVLAETASRRCNRPATLLLESPGGLVADGLWLGAQVRKGGLRTVARYECASSCGLIFLGGVDRVLWGARAAIGFHQAAWSRGTVRQCDEPDSGDSLKIRDYLRSMIPVSADEVFRIAMSTSCDAISWVRGERALQLGVATALEAQGVDVFGPKAAREHKP